MIENFITALEKQFHLTGQEMAELFWLAVQIEQAEDPEPIIKHQPVLVRENQTYSPSKITPSKITTPETTTQKPPPKPAAEIYTPPPAPVKETIQEHPTAKIGELPIKVPDAPSVREPLSLARSLRPLLRLVPSGSYTRVDEAATSENFAQQGLFLPVFKSDFEPWLDVDLVIDASVSMAIWRRTVTELKRFLEHYGVFRNVCTWNLTINEAKQAEIRPGIAKHHQNPRSPRELIDPQGRRLILLVSDCVSSCWHDGSILPTLKTWTENGMVAIAQMLPSWLWERTALGKVAQVQFSALTGGEFNHRLNVSNLSPWSRIDPKTGIKVPVLTLEPELFSSWTEMVGGKGGVSTPGVIFPPKNIPERAKLRQNEVDSPENRVQQFHNLSSPMARRLACLLAAAPVISLPVVRMIQQKLLKESKQVHVAEVFLGGLLQRISEDESLPLTPENEGNFDDYELIQYEFREGVRELLLDSLPLSKSVDVLQEVSQFVAEGLGKSLDEFGAMLRNPKQINDEALRVKIRPFAMVTAQVLRCLGGDYVSFADELEQEDRDLIVTSDIEDNDSENEQEIADLIATLENTRDDNIRRETAEKLAKIAPVGHKKAIAVLMSLLKTTQNKYTRIKVAQSLAQIDPGNERAIAALISLLETTQNEYTRSQVAQSLAQIAVGNERAIAALISLLKTTQNEYIRSQVAQSLAQIAGQEKVIAALISLLETTQDEYTRSQVAQSLAKIAPVGNEKVIAALISLLETTKDKYTRSQVAEILVQIAPVGHKKAIAALISLLETTQSEYICGEIAKSLAQIAVGNEKAIAALISLLKTTQNEYIFKEIAQSLDQIAGKEKAITALISLLETTQYEFTRRGVAQSLAQIAPVGNERAIAVLISLLETTQDEYTRREVAQSLARIAPVGHKKAIAVLISLLKNTQFEWIHYNIIDILEKIAIGNETAIAGLQSFIKTTKNKVLRDFTVDTLKKIERRN